MLLSDRRAALRPSPPGFALMFPRESGGAGLKRDDPNLQLLGMRHDGKFLEEGSDSWKAGIPKRGRFRARLDQSAFRLVRDYLASV